MSKAKEQTLNSDGVRKLHCDLTVAAVERALHDDSLTKSGMAHAVGPNLQL